jgi:hypothetical protein
MGGLSHIPLPVTTTLHKVVRGLEIDATLELRGEISHAI